MRNYRVRVRRISEQTAELEVRASGVEDAREAALTLLYDEGYEPIWPTETVTFEVEEAKPYRLEDEDRYDAGH